MARRLSLTIACPAWFPRPRGDGPYYAHFLVTPAGVPPPTRGWPPPRGWRGRRARGSPAHAGMARRGAQQPPPRPRFPRPRGDGPSAGDQLARRRGVPPPARGWPIGRFGLYFSHKGSPAHAGMARGGCSRSWGRRRFPRPRGDGPRIDGHLVHLLGVPPPTRGWPSLRRGPGPGAAGSPAHAGMARPDDPPSHHIWRFPRPRGDGPIPSLGITGELVVPPPTRGWPLAHESHHVGLGGSPAHAGMAPCPGRSAPG